MAGREGKETDRGLWISALLLPFVTRAWVEWRRGWWRGWSLVAVGRRELHNRRHPSPRNRCLEDPRRLGEPVTFPSPPIPQPPDRGGEINRRLRSRFTPLCDADCTGGGGTYAQDRPRSVPSVGGLSLGGKVSAAAGVGRTCRVSCRLVGMKRLVNLPTAAPAVIHLPLAPRPPPQLGEGSDNPALAPTACSLGTSLPV